ncbi:MAG TPA: LuxR C-terminal-related transcriptional regulator, partial [Anaerolineales bacterium]
IQSKLLNLQGKAAESRDLAKRALQILPQADAHVRSMLLANLAAAYQQILDYDKAAETFKLIVRDAQATGNHVLEILGISGQAQMVLQQGRLHTGFEIAAEGIKRFETSNTDNPFSATLFGETGQIYYQWHQLDRARSYLLRSAQVSGQSGYSDPEIYNHVMLSKMAQMEGDWDSAAQEMQQAGDLMRRIPPAMIRENIIAQQIWVDLALDHLSLALEALKAEGFKFDGELGFPGLASDLSEPVRPVTHPAGLLYNSALRLLLYQANKKHDLDITRRGLEMATRVLDGELQCQQLPVALETLLLRSQMYTALGDDEASLADLARAVELAEPERFISIFVEEGPPIAEALATLLKRNLIGHVGRGYVQDILAAFPQTQPSREAAVSLSASRSLAAKPPDEADESTAPVEPLTARELEILQLIAEGDSNRTIAEKLVITVSAVKKHTANIYGKLTVNSRTQAVARARQHGFLPRNG